MNKRQENFQRLLKNRMYTLSKLMSTISNLSNKSHYSYTDEEIIQLHCDLLELVHNTVSKFNVKQARELQFDIVNTVLDNIKTSYINNN
jgi:glycerol-3-phosphate responsive antiterminator|tara:strand:+ start:198 stop:464 length:267 start_codon:yes stop_codon:yes gene_type:complete